MSGDAGTQPYSPCTLIMPDGTQHPNKSVRSIRLMPVAQAVEALRANKAAWVRPDDAEAVAGQLAGKV